MRRSAEKVVANAKMAFEQRQNWMTLYETAYRYGIPNRQTFTRTQEGERKGLEVYDATGAIAARELANTLQSELFPPYKNWMALQAGPLVPEDMKKPVNDALQDVTEQLFAVLHHRSNFNQSIGELLIDLIAGTGAMMVQKAPPYSDLMVNYTTVPISSVAILEGADGMVADVYRKHRPMVSLVQQIWPEAKIPEDLAELAKEKPHEKTEVWDALYRSDNGTIYYDVIWEKDGTRMLSTTPRSGSPWVVARWSKTPGEQMGRGPLLDALSDILTLNKVIEFVLQNAALSIAGPYTVVDDGVLNPRNVRIAPKQMIKVARNSGHPQGPSIEPLQTSREFDVSAMVMEDLRMQIKQAMLSNTLPPLTGEVRTATEIMQRIVKLAKETGAAFGRIMAELVTPVVQKTLDIMLMEGLIKHPALEGNGIKIGGNNIEIVMTSPLAQLQNMDEVERFTNAVQVTTALFGPQVAMLAYNAEFAGTWIGQQLGVDEDLMRSEKDKSKLQQMAAKLIADMQAQGQDPSAMMEAS